MNRFRWEWGYLCLPPDFLSFWAELVLSSRRQMLLIAGRGFDPRTVEAPAALVAAGVDVSEFRLLHLVDRYNASHPPDQTERAEENERRIRKLLPDADIKVLEIEIRTEDGRTSGGLQVAQAAVEFGPLGRFTDVVVDITALPSSIFFPLIGTLLSERDRELEPTWNLHCVVCENATLDELILPEGGDRAERVYGFGGEYESAAELDAVRVWAPVLGERQVDALRKIDDAVGPSEVKPVLPFPSADPRRGDRLVAEYHSLIADSWEVDPQGFIYAHEQDPFDLYLQLGRLSRDYVAALEPIGTARTVLSSHTSKLLSLGVLLAAFEHGLPVMHVEPTGYRGTDLDSYGDQNQLFEVWLAGEAYEEAPDRP